MPLLGYFRASANRQSCHGFILFFCQLDRGVEVSDLALEFLKGAKATPNQRNIAFNSLNRLRKTKRRQCNRRVLKVGVCIIQKRGNRVSFSAYERGSNPSCDERTRR